MPGPEYHREINPAVPNAAQMASAVEQDAFRAERVFKDNRHNFAALVYFDNVEGRYLLKIPRARNQRLWQRMLSRFRPSEAIRQFRSFNDLNQLGFLAPVAVAAGEVRRAGFVTHSYLLYQYCEGRPATKEDSLVVARELRRLHALGYTRRDPKTDNFLIQDGRVIFIDFRLTQHRWFPRWHTTLEFAHALHTMPEAIDILPSRIRASLLFQFLYWYRLTLSRLKKVKRQLLRRDI